MFRAWGASFLQGCVGGRGGAAGLLNKGGGSNRFPGVVTKQQAVEFPQVQTSRIILATIHATP